MAKNKLKQIKQMIRGLSAEDRLQLMQFLAEFGLDEELEEIDEAYGKENIKAGYDPENFLFYMVQLPNLVSLRIFESEVFRVVFRPIDFYENFKKTKTSSIVEIAERFRVQFFNEEARAEIRAGYAASGEQKSDADIESEISEKCNAIAQLIAEQQAQQVTAGISGHLPRMVADMFSAAIKGQSIAGYNLIADQLNRPEKMLSTPEIKKMVTESFWNEIKPHVGVTRGGNTRTNPAWRDADTLRRYAQKVTDRKLLATCIKDMFEECEGEAGWIDDLKQSSNYRLLAKEVPDEVMAWGVKRVASEDLPAREREPLSIACEMARQELKLPEQSIETLRDYYSAGENLLRQDRKQKGK